MNSVTFPNRDNVLNYAITSAPVTGVSTVLATASEIFAGSSRKTARRCMFIKNESTDTRIRVGGSTVTDTNGFPIEPGAVFRFDFDPITEVPIYAISEGSVVKVSVMEY